MIIIAPSSAASRLVAFRLVLRAKRPKNTSETQTCGPYRVFSPTGKESKTRHLQPPALAARHAN
jgi:hypothetical protein